MSRGIVAISSWHICLVLLGCAVALPALGQNAGDPQKLVAEADRLAWLRAWTRAEPLYAQARAAFIAHGDKRNALYAEVSRLRGQLPTLAVPEVSDRLAAYLDDPIVAGDERLRLRVLTIKAETDADLDPALSQRSWTEALAIAEKVGDGGWANRARGELGLVAFLQGDTNTAIVNLGRSIKVAEASGDTSSVVRWVTLFGHGYVELNRPEQALDFYDRALKIAGTIPELQLPLMTYLGKADALVKLGRLSEAERLLTTALEAARDERAYGYQAELTLRLALVALQRKQIDQALDAMARATALARTAGGNRILAEIALERARVLRSLNRLSEADATLRAGIHDARAMGDRLLLPRLLAQLANVRLSRGRVTDAITMLEEADDIVEGLLTRASSPWVRSRIIAGMDDVLVARIRLEGERSRGDPARLFAVLERARARSLLDLLNSRPIASESQSGEWRTGERRLASLQLQLLRTTDRRTRQRLLDQIFVAEEQLAPISTGLFAAASRPARSPTSLAQVRGALRPDELLLEYVLAEPSSFAVAITRTDSRLLRLPGRSMIEAQIQSLGRAIQDGQAATDEARTLGATLVGAVSGIGRYRRLIVSADGMTHMVPFELLISSTGKHVRRKDFDSEKRVVHIRASKNETSKRVIPLNDSAFKAVQRMVKLADTLGHIAPEHYLWCASQHHKLDPTKPASKWDTAWRALRDAADLPGLRFHDLRHTVVTRLLEAGEPDHVVESITGHLSRRMLEHYSHIRLKAKKDALDRLDESGKTTIKVVR